MAYLYHTGNLPPGFDHAHFENYCSKMETHWAGIKTMPKEGLEEGVKQLEKEILEFQKKYERQGHEKAVARAGEVKNLSTTGWGLFDEIEPPFVIDDKFLVGSPVDELADSLTAMEMLVTNGPKLIDFPPEVLLCIFENIDSTTLYGRCALALTSKKLAIVSKKVKVFKTIMSVPLKPDTKLCVGCGKARSVDQTIWQDKSSEIQKDWDLADMGNIWDMYFPITYMRWMGQADAANGYDLSDLLGPQVWCPACQAQRRWENAEGHRLLEEQRPPAEERVHPDVVVYEYKLYQMLYIEKLLGQVATPDTESVAATT